ncbi:hypothetical protein CPB84DRAFT_761271 [Gymnopilus junonius]|uniref:Secreted protein n=1 Tax=Gymnopilus junonius TaxID=109634 RepID=A0A9P5TSZ0_GYMJU|nr:hypothetical protein CPB84DRAFT_761271 [Gymnopilus junonius]
MTSKTLLSCALLAIQILGGIASPIDSSTGDNLIRTPAAADCATAALSSNPASGLWSRWAIRRKRGSEKTSSQPDIPMSSSLIIYPTTLICFNHFIEVEASIVPSVSAASSMYHHFFNPTSRRASP